MKTTAPAPSVGLDIIERAEHLCNMTDLDGHDLTMFELGVRTGLSEGVNARIPAWIPIDFAVPQDGKRVKVKDGKGEGYAIATWHPFTVHEGKIINTEPQFSGWMIEANADLKCPVETPTHWLYEPIERLNVAAIENAVDVLTNVDADREERLQAANMLKGLMP